jgi:predicted tellurium resistance membrane protein TerC
MQFFLEPQAWVSFLTLAALEIVLGIDNILFLILLVNRLPAAQRASARLLGLGFAMVTRIALLYSVTWLAGLRRPLYAVLGHSVTGRDLILFGGGAFLGAQSLAEIRETLAAGDPAGGRARPDARPAAAFWLVIAQIGVLDIAFSLDSVFTAVGLANHIEVMIAAIVVSVLVMMAVSSAVSAFIDRHPGLKVLALAFLVLVAGALIGESLGREVPKGYLYFAMFFASAVQWLNLRMAKARSGRR